jgi:hypothetical protein
MVSALSSTPSQSISSVPVAEALHSNSELIQFLNEEISLDNNWTNDIDDPDETSADLNEDQNYTESDGIGLEEGLAVLENSEANSSEWSTQIHSCVLMDVWHAMACIKVPKEHGFHWPFARALCDAIFIPDQNDKLQITNYLNSFGSSWDDALFSHPKWL